MTKNLLFSLHSPSILPFVDRCFTDFVLSVPDGNFAWVALILLFTPFADFFWRPSFGTWLSRGICFFTLSMHWLVHVTLVAGFCLPRLKRYFSRFSRGWCFGEKERNGPRFANPLTASSWTLTSSSALKFLCLDLAEFARLFAGLFAGDDPIGESGGRLWGF